MLYLLLAVALCLLVPQLTVWVYRRLPRRTPPPPGLPAAEELAGLRREASEAVAEVVPAAGVPPAVEVPRGEATEPARQESSPPAPADPARIVLPSYRWLNALFSLALLPTGIALGAGWAVLFHHLGEAGARSFGPAVFLFKPHPYWLICAVPCLFLGVFSALPLLLLLMRLLLGRRRFIEALFWEEGRLGAEGREVGALLRSLGGFALVLGGACAVFVGLALNWYARFTENAVVAKRFLAAREEVHPYDSVVQVVWTGPVGEDGQPEARGNIHLRFADGTTWGTDHTFVLPDDPAERRRFLDFLAKKTGRPITWARSLQDVPGW
jgi:hypothetical protein